MSETHRPTMGNLFSGSGTWELAAKMAGIDVLFEAEIEPFPLAVEAKRFPEALQLGDVSKINGADIPPVDILTNSSPCQDLSVANSKNRAGLEGERSGLFSEAIRITKEMREREKADGRTGKSIRPRFWGWENVPGAFNSGGKGSKGADFKAVLESIAEIIEEKRVDIPIPSGGWHYSGLVDLENGQIAWRVLDAQYELPQRRRRIFLVADLAGHCAEQILFERESIPWDFKEIASAWKDTSRSLGDRISSAGRIVMGEVRRTEEGVGDCCVGDKPVTGEDGDSDRE